ncbi:MAG: hypothetical protein ACRD4B_04645, partial [Acidobacteriota bacterium]
MEKALADRVRSAITSKGFSKSQWRSMMKCMQACSRAGKSLVDRESGLARQKFVSWRIALLPLLVTFFLAGFTQTAGAQKVYSIGSLNTAEQFISAFEGFKSRMRELG